ncbi:hypothetical protein GCM10010211_46160 [Streptomyces albospinus]|uniref:Uncharacterized protein n=1 Tax=Streptomyces albospinus TaxID=285515 RepID=A0ABQ2V9H7_9ACTN|nr:hypothetical protein GCM10010211_46160 [Streptomyces albospinus]
MAQELHERGRHLVGGRADGARLPASTRCRAERPALSESTLTVGCMDHHDEMAHGVRNTARGPRAAIEIDGNRWDPGSLSGCTISHQEGEPPHVVLHVENEGAAEFEGLARVAVAGPVAVEPTAAEFLAAIGPEELERAVPARPDLGTSPYSLTKAVLTQLGERARGACSAVPSGRDVLRERPEKVLDPLCEASTRAYRAICLKQMPSEWPGNELA